MENSVSIVILAAGLGTRMKSRRAKVLHRAGGRTLIEHVVRMCRRVTDPARVVVVVGHQAEQVEAELAGYGVRFALQTEQRGTGHAVLAAREAAAGLGDFVAVLYGDGPLLTEATLRALIDKEIRSGAAATIITTTMGDPTGYGRVLTDAQGRVQAVVEQKAATPEQLAIKLANSGIYCFRAEPLWKHLAEIRPNNPAGEYYLTDMVEILRRAGHDVQALHVDDESELQGINSRADLARVDRLFRERKVQELMDAGVTVEKPETVTIDDGVTVGADVTIGPFVQILGETDIGEDCTVGACSILRNAKLAAGVTVGEFTIVQDSVIGEGAVVGPYARLRFGNEVAAGAAIGNFVELKKTRFGAGSKAMHLAYLGDSVIGADVNIGAGTITCNYDGLRKHPTVIGDGAFVGSNSTLVAPVEVGAGSYVGAGSVITEAVPPDALGLGRQKQINKPGWARHRRETLRQE